MTSSLRGECPDGIAEHGESWVSWHDERGRVVGAPFLVPSGLEQAKTQLAWPRIARGGQDAMKGREFAKLAQRHLMPHLPGFALKGGLIYALPVDRLWRRFDLCPSAFSRESFTVYCAVSPLYVPDTRTAYPSGLGDRLPILARLGDRWWTWQPGDEEAEATMMAELRELMINVGVPHLRELRDPAAVAERLLDYPEHVDDPNVAEALAYSLILAGSYELAREKLELLRSLTLDNEERATWWADLHAGSREPPGEDWVIVVGKRGAAVAEALEQSPHIAIGLLDEWNERQLAALRLPRSA